MRAAIRYALAEGRRSVTLVHKGNIMKFTEGAFRDWGYQLAEEEYGERAVAWEDCGGRRASACWSRTSSPTPSSSRSSPARRSTT